MPTKPTKTTAKSTTPKPDPGELPSTGPSAEWLSQLDLRPIPREVIEAEAKRFQPTDGLSAEQLAKGRALIDEHNNAPVRQVELLRQMLAQSQSQQQQVLAQLQALQPQQQVELLQQIRDQLQAPQPQPQSQTKSEPEPAPDTLPSMGTWYADTRKANPQSKHETDGQYGARMWDLVPPHLKDHWKRKSFMRRFYHRST